MNIIYSEFTTVATQDETEDSNENKNSLGTLI